MFSTTAEIFSNPLFSKGIEIAIGIVIILLLAAVARRVLLKPIADAASRRRVRKIISRVTLLLIVFAIAIVYSSSLGGLGVSLGLVGAGVAFALQNVISNAAARLLNVTGSYYKVGDRIELGGVKGDVIGISAMSTTIMEIGDWVKADQYNGRVVRVANGNLFSSPVYNYSSDFPFLWDEITIPVKYGADREQCQELFTRIATRKTSDLVRDAKQSWQRATERYAIEPARLEPLITLVANDNWLEYTIRYVSDYRQRRVTKSELFNAILDEIDASEGRISIASSTYDIVALPPVRIETSADIVSED